MSDPNTPDDTPQTPNAAEPAPAPEHPQAKRGVKDAGKIVSSAGGELIDGRIADITDGDR